MGKYTFETWYENGTQHLAHTGWSHTLCLNGVGHREMSSQAGMPLSQVKACPECTAIADMLLAGYPATLASFDEAIRDVIQNADEHKAKHPAMTTLVEEFAEAVLASRGKHDHPVRLELVQIAGICINLIRQIDNGETMELRSPKRD